MKAKLAYNYGWTDQEILDLPWKTLSEYYTALTPLIAEETCLMMNTVAYPHLKTSKATKLFKSFKGLCDMVSDDDGPVERLSTKDVAKNLARRLMGGS